jgi:two-component sensor histidine kinase
MSSVSALSTRRNRHYRLLSLLWIFLVLGALTFYLAKTHQYTYQLISASSENEAALLSRSMNSALRRARTEMDWAGPAVLEATSSQDYAEIESHLADQTQRFPEIHGFVVYGPDQQPFISAIAVGPLCAVDFSAYIDDADSAYSYSNSVDCTTTGTRIMMVYRLLRDATGTAVGTIATIVNLSYYEHLFSRIDVGQRGMVSIRRSDTSRLVVRWPIRFDRMNNAAPEIPPQRLVEAGVSSGVVRYVGATDGVDRIFAYNQVEDYPFYVLVGRGYDEQFTSWRIISSIAAAAALFMILLTVLLLRRLDQETVDLVTTDAGLRKALKDKEGLIRELLHRTNNSLQVTRSLVQLEILGGAHSENETGALTRLDYRIGVLSLVQQMLHDENNYTSIPLKAYLDAVRKELLGKHPLSADAVFEIDCPETELVLDAAAPLGLIVAELCSLSTSSSARPRDGARTIRVDLTVTMEKNPWLTVTYSDNRSIVPDANKFRLITSLAEHQLGGTLAVETDGRFRCAITFKPGVYIPRIEP